MYWDLLSEDVERARDFFRSLADAESISLQGRIPPDLVNDDLLRSLLSIGVKEFALSTSEAIVSEPPPPEQTSSSINISSSESVDSEPKSPEQPCLAVQIDDIPLEKIPTVSSGVWEFLLRPDQAESTHFSFRSQMSAKDFWNN